MEIFTHVRNNGRHVDAYFLSEDITRDGYTLYKFDTEHLKVIDKIFLSSKGCFKEPSATISPDGMIYATLESYRGGDNVMQIVKLDSKLSIITSRDLPYVEETYLIHLRQHVLLISREFDSKLYYYQIFDYNLNIVFEGELTLEGDIKKVILGCHNDFMIITDGDFGTQRIYRYTKSVQLGMIVGITSELDMTETNNTARSSLGLSLVYQKNRLKTVLPFRGSEENRSYIPDQDAVGYIVGDMKSSQYIVTMHQVCDGGYKIIFKNNFTGKTLPAVSFTHLGDEYPVMCIGHQGDILLFGIQDFTPVKTIYGASFRIDEDMSVSYAQFDL